MTQIALQSDGALLFHADCLDVLRALKTDSIDALVTDPPAGIGFMGKDWDGDKGGRDQWVAWLAGVMREALRVLKPGAHALVWALPRTSHWTATALEDAGFEIRDVVMHLFGTGFPKSLNIGDGRGTALKPAAEHWILCRKPLAGTVAANVQTYGTGALNIDACRIGTTEHLGGGAYAKTSTKVVEGHHTVTLGVTGKEFVQPEGRWPAHLTLDEEAAALLDAQSGIAPAKKPREGGFRENAIKGNVDFKSGSRATLPVVRGDNGGASRFFYVAKPSRAERDAGCEHLPVRSGGEATDRTDGSAGLQNPRAGAGRNGGARNFHPTVKPVALMRWLCRLITPPGGVVLDLFAGSGTTGVAALAEGFRFVGVERDPDYLPIGTARLRAALAEVESE